MKKNALNLTVMLIMLVSTVFSSCSNQSTLNEAERTPQLNANTSFSEFETWISTCIERYIKETLNESEEYFSITLTYSSIVDKNGGRLSFESGKKGVYEYIHDYAFTTSSANENITEQSINLSDENSYPPKLICVKHTFAITNKEGATSHFRKFIYVNLEGDIIDYKDDVYCFDATLFGNKHNGPLLVANDNNLILWGESIVRKYIENSKMTTEKYIPLKWHRYTKFVCRNYKIDSKELAYDSTQIKPLPILENYTDWDYAALYIIHNYKLIDWEQTEHEFTQVFIINPDGRMKIASLDRIESAKLSGRDTFKLLYQDFPEEPMSIDYELY